MSLWQRLACFDTRSWEARYRALSKDRRKRKSSRRIGPMVALLEDRTLLSTATLTTLAVSASTLTYGHAEVLTATVTTDPVSSTTPAGGTVSFMDGSTTLDTEALTGGGASFKTRGLGVGLHVLTAVYNGDAAFRGSSTPLATTSIIRTIAGGGNGDGGLATAASLNSPLDVAVDASGDIFIADSTNNVIREVNAATGVITTVAGDGSSGYSGDGQQAAAALLDYPTAIALDSSGDLFIADSVNNVIREVSGGVINTVAGGGSPSSGIGDGGPATAALLSNPSSVAVDSSGNLYIADYGDNVIREVSGGVINTVAGDGSYGYSGDGHQATAALLSGPTGVAVDTSGNLYIADSGNNVIREVSGGVINTVAGNGTAGYSGDGNQPTGAELSNPTGVAVDSFGNVYIADTDNNVIREVSGGVINTIAGGGSPSTGIGDGGPATNAVLSNPYAVAVDSSGNLYIADTENDVIREVAGGVINTVAGDGFVTYSGDGGQATSAGLSYPSSVAVDASGNIYIADFYNSVVREVNAATGVITTIAGDGTAGYSGDGKQATGALLNAPTGVAVDAAGDIFIADSGNNVIREVSGGVINTIAGDGTAGYSGDGLQATSALLDAPEAIALDVLGNLYIADTGNNVIREVTGGVITTIAGDGTYGYSGDGLQATAAELGGPTGVAVDSSGNLYIVDAGNNVIREVSLGVINTIAGGGTPSSGNGDGGPATGALLSNPGEIAVDSSGNVYIVDSGDNSIREVTVGVINTFAGNGSIGYSGDGGTATDAELYNPAGVAVDASGNVYIADAGNNVIREVPISTAGAQSVTVDPAPLIVTADSTSKTYGDTMTFVGTEFTDAGLVTANGDTVTSVTLTSAGAAGVATVAGSPYDIVPSAAIGKGLSNYAITYDNGQLAVDPYAFTYTIANDSQTHGSPANLAADLVATIKTGVNDENLAIAYSSTGDSATAHANTYAITGALSNGTGLTGDYLVTLTPGTLTVNKDAFSYTIGNDSQTYGSPANLGADLGATINTGVNGENLGITYSSTGDTATAHSNTYAITGALSNGTGLASDYAVTMTSGTLTVNKKAFSYTIANDSQTYGSPANLATDLGATINTGVNGENLAIAHSSTGDTATAHVNTYAITGALSNGTGLTSDYAVTLTNGTLTVNKTTFTYTIANDSQTYGTAANLAGDFGTTINTGANGENLGIAYSSAGDTATTHVNTYAITGALSNGTGLLSDYDVTLKSGTLTVNPAALLITADSMKKTYGEAVTFAGTEFIDSGLVTANGDTVTSVTLASAGAAAAATAGGSPYAITPSSAVGTGLSNYSITYVNGQLTANEVPLTITAVSQTMVAGQAVPSLTATFRGFVNGDTAASLTTPPELTTPATPASPAGSYPIVASGAGSANYSISFVNGTLTVIPAPATVLSVSIQKVPTGKHKTTKAIVLQFSEALNSVDAQIINTYNLVTVPKKKKQRGQRVAISKATYNAQAFTVTLITRKLLALNPPLKLTITAAALLDALNRPLNGNNSGQSGANYVATISKKGVTVDS